MRAAPVAETLSQSPIDHHSPQHSPIGREPQYSGGMTSTVTILPSSPLDLARNPFNTSLPPRCSPTTSPHRPKLSLNTACSQQRTLGKGNTGLRLDTLSANSPTIQNTFKNGYDAPTAAATPLQAIEPSSLVQRKQHSLSSSSSPKPPTPHPLNQSTPSSSSGESSGESSPDLSKASSPKVPYVLGKHPRSILSNSPLPKRPRSRGDRRVGFHENIEEKIQTTKYIAQHYDLIVASDSSSEGDEARAGSKRESPCEEETIEEDSGDDESYPKTPVAGRKKRRREWVWTLGPLDGAANHSPSANENHGCADTAPERPQDPPRIAVPRPPRKN